MPFAARANNVRAKPMKRRDPSTIWIWRSCMPSNPAFAIQLRFFCLTCAADLLED